MARAPSQRPELQADLRQTQRLVLSPQLRQNLAFLRLPADALAEELARLAQENPWLRVRPPSVSGYDVALAEASGTLSFQESLATQLAQHRHPPEVLRAALRLVAELREDGYLDTPLSELADEELTVDVLRQGLRAVQACEPAGVGARTLTECLTLQLEDMGLAPALAQKVVGHLAVLVAGGDAAARALGLPTDEAARLSALVSRLRPKLDLGQGTATPSRLPELLVTSAADGSLRVQPHPASSARVSLAQDYARGLSPELDRAFAEARAVLSAVERRVETLLAIGGHIIARQAAFFLSGGAHLRPETQAAAAEALGLAPSTLSRAISAKSLEYQGRTWPLALFFPRALDSAFGAQSVFDVQRRLSALVADEPPDAPLSDEALARQLQAEGVDIARRTVAKYRACLRIAPSSQRRRRV